mmetsp:Transcript_14578/g.37253  ORF Transcript_14578/g.37253 Transcript_14578/m.37253 type:complete len:267 (-) Transcript_14578:570-1370(-)
MPTSSLAALPPRSPLFAFSHQVPPPCPQPAHRNARAPFRRPAGRAQAYPNDAAPPHGLPLKRQRRISHDHHGSPQGLRPRGPRRQPPRRKRAPRWRCRCRVGFGRRPVFWQRDTCVRNRSWLAARGCQGAAPRFPRGPARRRRRATLRREWTGDGSHAGRVAGSTHQLDHANSRVLAHSQRPRAVTVPSAIHQIAQAALFRGGPPRQCEKMACRAGPEGRCASDAPIAAGSGETEHKSVDTLGFRHKSPRLDLWVEALRACRDAFR